MLGAPMGRNMPGNALSAFDTCGKAACVTCAVTEHIVKIDASSMVHSLLSLHQAIHPPHAKTCPHDMNMSKHASPKSDMQNMRNFTVQVDFHTYAEGCLHMQGTTQKTSATKPLVIRSTAGSVCLYTLRRVDREGSPSRTELAGRLVR